MKNSARSRKSGRFISRVHKEIQKAFVKSGLKQRDLAERLEVDRSLVNRQLLGQSNITLRTIADMAWAMDCDIEFSLFDNLDAIESYNRRPMIVHSTLSGNELVETRSSGVALPSAIESHEPLEEDSNFRVFAQNA